MSKTSKSPRMVAACAMEVGARTLAPYAHRFSPRTFTQPRLFAILVLRKFFRTDYRGIVAYLADMPRLCKDLRLKRLPHYTTLQKAEARLLANPTIRDMLSESVELYLGGGDDEDDDDELPIRAGYVIDTVATAFDEEVYHQRWQAETVMFMLKVRQGAALCDRTAATCRREMNLMAITHNLMILLRWAKSFSTGQV